MRSSAEWINVAARSADIARSGKKPYATVPNAARSQWLSVKPEQIIGTGAAPGSVSATNDSSADQSGVASGESVPPSGPRDPRSASRAAARGPGANGSDP